ESVAVLPFASPGGDAGGTALAAGLTESLVNSLSRLPGVRVAPRTATARYRGERDLTRVARELDVRAVVTGQVTQRDATLVVSAALTDVAKSAELWGGRYLRDVADIVELDGYLGQDVGVRGLPRAS